MTQQPQTDPPPSHLEHALLYARLGWPVAPTHYAIHRPGEPVACSCVLGWECKDLGKHPVGRWRQDATTNATTIREWWEKQPHRNIALIAGRKAAMDEPEEGGGFVVIDVDNGVKASGVVKNGFADLETLQSVMGPLPQTVEAASGSGGGRHLLYKHPGGSVYIPTHTGIKIVKDGAPLVLSAIDVRGDGGYIIAPPSTHASGNRYQWIEGLGPGDIEVAELPDDYLALFAESPGAAMTSHVVPEGNWPPVDQRIKRARAYVTKLPVAIQGERGSDAAFTVAIHLVRGFCLPLDAAYDIFMSGYNPHCRPPWSEREVKKKLRDAADRGKRPYGFAFSRDIEWALAKEEERLAQVVPIRPRLTVVPALAEAAAEPSPAPEPQTDEPPPPSGPRQPPPPPPPGGGGGPANDDGGEDGDGSNTVHHNFIIGDHVELARAALAVLTSASRPVIYDEGTFWRYNPTTGLWDKLTETWIEGQVNRFSGNLVGEDKILKIRDSDTKGTVRVMKGELARIPTPYSFATAPPGVACRNGFLRVDTNLQEGTCDVSLVPHSPFNMARYQINANWCEEVQPAPMMDQFFRVLFCDVPDPEESAKSQALLQEFLGVSVVGLAPKFEKCLFLEGSGSNGKSQVLALFRSLFPPSAVSSVAPHDWGKQFTMEKLLGSYLNVYPDISSNDMRDDQIFKQVVTGDMIQVDRKYEKVVSFCPIAGHLFAANSMPVSLDSTHGFWRRVMVLPLTAQLDRRPDRIVDIGTIIGTTEAAQVLRWAIDGLKRVIANHRQFTVPRRTIERLEDWRTDSDDVREFLIDHISDAMFQKLASKQGIPVGELHAGYIAWVDSTSNGVKNSTSHHTINKFSRKLTENSDIVSKSRAAAIRLVFSTPNLISERLRRQSVAAAIKASLGRDDLGKAHNGCSHKGTNPFQGAICVFPRHHGRTNARASFCGRGKEIKLPWVSISVFHPEDGRSSARYIKIGQDCNRKLVFLVAHCPT